jgi:hypothetical protein
MSFVKKKILQMGKPKLHKRESSIFNQLAEETTSLPYENGETWFLLFPTKQHWKNNADIQGIEEGLNAVIINPCVILGPGNWNETSLTLFKNASKGMKFYPTGANATVDARDVDLGVQASTVVSLGNVAAVGILRAHGAVVRALSTGETSLGPAKRRHAIGLEQGVLLLNPKPGHQGLGLLHGVGSLDAGVVLDGRHVGLVAVAHHQNVLAATERVREDGLGLEEDLGVVAGGLARGGAVKVPDGAAYIVGGMGFVGEV